MSEEPKKPEDDAEVAEVVEGTPSADAPRSEETAAAAGPETTRGASPQGEPSRPHGDALSDAVDEVAAEPTDVLGEEEAAEAAAGEEAGEEAPGRRRRPSRRRSAEPAQAEANETPGAPAPTRRRAHRDPNVPAPVVRAQAKYVRSSARKARLVCDHIRGKSVEEARAILAVTPRAIAREWSKLLESAVANAEHNHELVGEDLLIKAVHADEGPTIKRFRPRAMGRATRILKRTSHLTILLTPKD